MRADLLITDLDGTLLGNEEALARFTRWWRQQRHRTRLVYASGRFCDSVEASIHHQQLPLPDAIIGGVGTEIRLLSEANRVSDWEQNSWPLWDRRRVRESLANLSQLVLQPPEFQSEFKISYYVSAASREFLESMRRTLVDQGILADIIYSSSRDLDIVPQGMNKGAAAMFLACRWNISRGAVIVAGDSGNDTSLFQNSCRGIIVSNAQPELRALAGPSAYLSKLPFAGGVLDGLRHWLGTEYRDLAA